MKALLLIENAKLSYASVPDPREPKAGEVLVRVKYAGICGSDLPRAFEGKTYHYPLIMGHEFSGLVEAVPSGSAYTPGERVTVFPLIPCRSCPPCQTGDFAQCENYDYLGSRRDGGFAELVLVPEANLFRIPPEVELVSAAMTEPCAVALHGISKLCLEAGMDALVIGGGPIGLMAAQWLRLAGAHSITVADVDPAKLALARDLGLEAFDSSKADLVAEFQGGRGGADCVVEACGLPATFLQAVECASRFGQVLFMGNIRGTLQIPEKSVSRILRNELRIRGTWNSKMTPRGKDEWTRVLAYMERGIKVRCLISHVPPLSQGPEIFNAMVSRQGNFNRVVFQI
jgi:L-iditol 2-dehydrogenase/galactitol-1-phosphate 5-dehydrogenase